MSPNVPPVGRAGSGSCLAAGVLQAAKGGLGLLLAALAQEWEPGDAEWEDESLFCSFWTQTGAREELFWLCTAADRRRDPALGLQLSWEHRGAGGAPGA